MQTNYKELLFKQKGELEFLKDEIEEIIGLLPSNIIGENENISERFGGVLNKIELMVEEVK